MNFDMVHDTQKIYRKILNCLSRPGVVENIALEGDRLDFELPLDKDVMALALTLLDGEVSFAVIGVNRIEIEQKIQQMTYAKTADAAQADYLFIMKDTEAEAVQKAILEAKNGTLIDPHVSATLILEVSNDFEAMPSEKLLLKGPGIKEEIPLVVSDSAFWLNAREEKNAEFPLGIDMFFVDAYGNLIALPRTTRIFAQEVG